jgi:hypothetical protein
MGMRRLFALTAALLGVLGTSVLWTGDALAQDGGPPPWPILLEGTVVVNGTVASGELTAHIDDWVSPGVTVVAGVFGCVPCLIIGPPTSTYVGKPVSFRLATIQGPIYQADLTFPFPSLPEPSKNSTELIFLKIVAIPTVEPDGLGGRFGLLAAGGATTTLVAALAFALWRRRQA